MYLIFPSTYLGLILFGFICVLSLYDYQRSWSFFIDFLLAIVGLAGGLYIWVTIGAQLADQYM
jgi:hypothetical protein